jgi:glycosyltransferase involved in cell wall biosynthesis
VAHCVHGLGLGGAQKVIASIVRGTDPARLRHVVYSCDDGVHRAEIEAAGARVRIVPRRIPKLDPGWVVALGRVMRTDGVDVVHTHLFGDSLHGYLAARGAGDLPVVMTMHIGLEGLTGLQRWGYRRLMARVAQTVACSRAVERSFAPWNSAARGRLSVIVNGIEPPDPAAASGGDVRGESGAMAGEVLLGCIGRLEEQKGHRVLLDAFARLVREGGVAARLAILGDGSLRAALAAQAAAGGVADRVYFAGVRSDVPAWLTALDVVVFSSLYEGLPVALLEAMAAARPLVVTAVPGMLEAVTADREALVVPIGDAAALAAALRRVASDPALAARLGAAAAARFSSEFTAARMVARYAALYEAVVSAPGLGRGARRASPR